MNSKTFWVAAIVLILIIVVAAIVYVKIPSGENGTSVDDKCASSGGTVTEGLCCLMTEDFPNSCLIGACGCSPENSHSVKGCDCGEGKCFDGEKCVGA